MAQMRRHRAPFLILWPEPLKLQGEDLGSHRAEWSPERAELSRSEGSQQCIYALAE